MGVFLVKAAYGKTVRAVWAADGGQPERAPPPTLQPQHSGEGPNTRNNRCQQFETAIAVERNLRRFLWGAE